MTDRVLHDIFTKSLHDVEYTLCVLAYMLEIPTSQEHFVVVHEPSTLILAASQVSHQAFVHLSKKIFLQRAQSAQQQTTLGQSQVRCLLFLRDICFVPELCFSIPAFRWDKAYLEV